MEASKTSKLTVKDETSQKISLISKRKYEKSWKALWL